MDDIRIAMLFGEWLAAERRTRAARGDGELNEFVDMADAVLRRLAAEPAQGVRGLAIKSFMLAHCAVTSGGMYRRTDDPGAVALPRVDGYQIEAAARGVLLDLAALVPELRSLIIAEQESAGRTLPDAGFGQ
jgi:hypothetical protein